MSFRAKKENNEYPCKPQFYYIKVGCKGVLNTRTCYPGVLIAVYTSIRFFFSLKYDWLPGHFAVSRASLIFQKRFQDDVSS